MPADGTVRETLALRRINQMATGACVVLGVLLAPRPLAQPADDGESLPVEAVMIADEIFTLEVVATPETRERGLMGRPHLDPDQGMLFVFPGETVHSFWMAHTLVDLDIVFLDDEGVVTAVHTMAAEPPQRDDESEWDYHDRLPRYSSRSPCRFAIEFKAGTLGLLKLAAGSHVALDWGRLCELAR